MIFNDYNNFKISPKLQKRERESFSVCNLLKAPQEMKTNNISFHFELDL